MIEDDVFELAKQSDLGFLLGDSWMLQHEFVHFAKLVADRERERCLSRVDLALLGADRALRNRVIKAINARGEA